MSALAVERIISLPPVAVIDGEAELARRITPLEAKAAAMTIETDGEYAEAAEFARDLKRYEAQVTEFYAPQKAAAHAAHKAVCDGEKKMLSPVLNAMAALKRSMGAFSERKEAERRAAEEAARALARAEAEKKLAEAVEAEAQGDTEKAAEVLFDAQMAENAAKSLTFETATPKAAGVSQSRDWEIISLNETAVPIDVSGALIRPVDINAAMRLIRGSKGTVEILGIVYREIIKTSVRK